MRTTSGVLLQQFQRVVYKFGNLQCGSQKIGSHLVKLTVWRKENSWVYNKKYHLHSHNYQNTEILFINLQVRICTSLTDDVFEYFWVAQYTCICIKYLMRESISVYHN